MENLNFYFFHGFLGGPEDWDPVVEHTPHQENWRFHFPDIEKIMADRSDVPSMAEFAIEFQEKHFDPKVRNIVVGYSMGGRLAMHFSPDRIEKMMLIAAHPGMCQGHETRRQLDQRWIDLGNEKGMDDWILEWNSQPIFRNDRNRPHRDFTETKFKNYLRIMEKWSLANQKNQSSHLAEMRERVFWSFGKNDDKYVVLAKEMEKTLGKDRVIGIEQAGHGVIFDQPQAVASWIGNVVDEELEY